MVARSTFLVSALCATACSSAYADQPVAGPSAPAASIALGVASARLRAPYDVQILRSGGDTLPTFSFGGRYYVQGSANERYVIRITNPTGRRIEAVVSVDGLDVIDGENGDLRKRGYIVPAYGETRIEGFRTSQADVATFRFSSVAGSYAGQKGKARNVGVIAVALFEERPLPREQEIIVGEAPRPRHRYDYRGAADDAAPSAGRSRSMDEDKSAKADGGAGAEKRPARVQPAPDDVPAPPPAAPSASGYGRYVPPRDYEPDVQRDTRNERLGLGTEFGEQRGSWVSYTSFVRAPGRPVAIAELRYNDAAGLIALGIPVQRLPDEGEVMMRETADPFPGDHFARPPRYTGTR